MIVMMGAQMTRVRLAAQHSLRMSHSRHRELCILPRGRCMNGYDCEFCHYEHDKRKRKNKTKKRAEAAGMRFAPRSTLHAASMAYNAAAAQRSWMYQSTASPHHSMAGFPYGSMTPGVAST